MILFQVDTTYIQISQKNPEQFRRKEVTRSVQSLKLADLKSAADEPLRRSRKQKLDKWQWKLKFSENQEQTEIYEKQHIQ